MDRIERTWKDLNFDEVDFDNGKWHFSRGGYPLQDYEYSISYCESFDSPEIRYKLPNCINNMLQLEKKSSRGDIVTEFKTLFNIR